MLKKVLFSSVCLLLACSLSACDWNDPPNDSSSGVSQQLSSSASSSGSTEPEGLESLSLPIDASDSFHPYKARSRTNISLLPLLYDPLVKINPDYGLDYEIAQSVTASGTTVTVTLREEITFTDGSPVTAADVVYSLNEAKAAGSSFATKVDNIASVTGQGNTVVIGLAAPDSLFAYALDVPIVKAGSLTDSGAVGSGRYQLVNENGAYRLTYNTAHYKQQAPKFTEISLIGMPSWDAITAGVKIGTVNYVYTDDINSALTGSGAAIGSAPLNHLLFIGVNSSSGVTADPKVRQAIASVVDRDKMVSDVYGGKGMAAALPYREGMGLGTLPEGFETDTTRANTLLDEAGFTEKDTYDVRQTNGGALTFEILVPQDSAYKVVAANTLVEQLRACGVKAVVTGVDEASYTDRIAKGNFQLYIGEILLENNLDFAPFFGGGAASYGIVLPNEFKAAYDAFLNNADSFGEYAAQFAQAMPFIPVAFANATVIYSRNLGGTVTPSVSDAFYNIEQWQ